MAVGPSAPNRQSQARSTELRERTGIEQQRVVRRHQERMNKLVPKASTGRIGRQMATLLELQLRWLEGYDLFGCPSGGRALISNRQRRRPVESKDSRCSDQCRSAACRSRPDTEFRKLYPIGDCPN